MDELILYPNDIGRSQIWLQAGKGTAWLKQLDMADLLGATKQIISLYLKNIFQAGELGAGATVKESLMVQTERARKAQRPVSLYNLYAILAVRYRLRPPRGVQIRHLATIVLKKYLLKGFAIDDERLKSPGASPPPGQTRKCEDRKCEETVQRLSRRPGPLALVLDEPRYYRTYFNLTTPRHD